MNDYTLIVNNKFLSAVKSYAMLDCTQNVVVGFSGGADSVCLIHLLKSNERSLGIRVMGAHLNHGIRGDEAGRDEDFCKAFCNEHNIPFVSKTINCVEDARIAGKSVEEYGREARYSFFESICNDDAFKIATAHNANDNAETVLFNLARGSGVKGVCGIPAVRGNIIRPILYCTRQEIEGYCKENNLQFVTDSTNLCDDYTRNKIRHNVLPVLNDVNSSAISNISMFSDRVTEVYELLAELACRSLSEARLLKGCYNADYLLTLNKALCKQCIVLAFNEFSSQSLDSYKINCIYELLYKKGRLQIYGNVYAEVLKNRFRFFEITDTKDASMEIDISTEMSVDFNGYTIKFTKYDNNSKKFNKKLLDNLVNCDKIIGTLTLRTRREGDRISLCNRNVTKSLKKLFNELNIPVEERSKIPVLCDECGIVWVYGVGTDNRCRIIDNSSNIIFIGGETNG